MYDHDAIYYSRIHKFLLFIDYAGRDSALSFHLLTERKAPKNKLHTIFWVEICRRFLASSFFFSVCRLTLETRCVLAIHLQAINNPQLRLQLVEHYTYSEDLKQQV